jgi:hypothetical protein
VLQADRQPHVAWGDAGGELGLGVELGVVVDAGWMARLRASPMLATW